MTRPLRVEFPGAIYHVTSRGDRREVIYLDDVDRAHWLKIFGNVCLRYRWRCLAYCLMGNHYHVVIETTEGNLSAGMRQLNGVYTQWHNRRHRCVGHVFQGRFKAIVVQADAYLLELVRYVVLNPVRARLCVLPENWEWSSYLPMCGKRAVPSWLEVDRVLSYFGGEASQGRVIEQFTNHVRAGIGLPSIWGDLRNQWLLGTEDFEASIRQRLERFSANSEIPKVQRRSAFVPLEQFVLNPDRKVGMAMAYETGCFLLAEVAKGFGVHYSTVSRATQEYASRGESEIDS